MANPLYTPRQDSLGRYWKLAPVPQMKSLLPVDLPPTKTGEPMHLTQITITIDCRHPASLPPDFQNIVRGIMDGTLRAAEE